MLILRLWLCIWMIFLGISASLHFLSYEAAIWQIAVTATAQFLSTENFWGK